jgi:putative spermidine/putrescine transport system permease protein
VGLRGRGTAEVASAGRTYKSRESRDRSDRRSPLRSSSKLLPGDRTALLMIPALLFLGLAFFAPVGIMMSKSLTEPSWVNYRSFIHSTADTTSLRYTVEIAALVTMVCILAGYPWAYLIHHSQGWRRAVLVAVVLIPFWSSLLVRTYAWTILLRPSGVINYVLVHLHLVKTPLTLEGNTLGVVIGMSQVLLPFMVFPIVAVMSRVQEDYVQAARGLGATPRTVFVRIFLPLTRPGLLAGTLLVFVVSTGFYITPAILGSAFRPMLGQEVATQAFVLFRFGYASTLAVIVVVVIIATMLIAGRFVKLGDVLGYEQTD